MPEATRTFSWRTLLALVMIPVLVAGGFLWGTWNSSDRLKQVQAAVVNLDEGVTLNDQFIPLGRQLSADLVDSSKDQNFTWVLADEAHAWPGLASGQYAAVVVIPENFSKAATSYGNDDPLTAEQATIEVHTSPVAGVADGYLGNVLANSASRTLNQTLTKAYLDQIYIGFNDTGKQFQTVADASGKLADGAESLSAGVGQAADGAGELSTGMGKLVAGSPALVKGVQQVETGAGKLADGLQTMKSKTKDLPSQGKKLASGTKEYVEGANKLADQLVAAGTGTATLATNLGKLSGGLTQVTNTISGWSADPTSLVPQCTFAGQANGQDLCAAYYEGIATGAGASAQALTTGEDGNAPGVQQGLKALSDGVNAQLPTAEEAAAQAELLAQFRAGGKDLVSGTADLGSGLGELSSGIGRVADGATKLANGLPQLTSGVTQYTGGVDAAAGGVTQLASGLTKAADGSTQLADGARKLSDGLAKGADKVPSFTKAERENLATVVANPVDTSNIQGVVSPNVAWVSLLVALALWLGALATFAVIKPLDGRLALSTAPTATLIARALLPGVIVAAAQAIVLTAIGTAVLGLALPKAAAMAGFLVLAGVAFVLVNHALAAWFGNVGRLISIAFAVITTVSALTSAVPGVFDTLRPISPLTPALDGLRAILTDASGAPAAVFALAGWAVVALGASAAAVIRRRTVRLTELDALA